MATPAGKVPIVESAKAGYAFMRANLRALAPAAGIGAVIFAITEHFSIGDTGTALLLQLALIAFQILFTASILRLALRPHASGFFGMQAGKDEANLLGAGVAIGFFLFIIAVVGALLFTFAFAAAAQQSGVDVEGLQGDPAAMQAAMATLLSSPQGLPVMAVLAVVLAALCYLGARLTLASPATIGERKIMAFSTWRWTEGNGLRIIATICLVVLPLGMGVGVIAGVLASAMGVGAPADIAAPARIPCLLLAGFGQYLLVTPALTGLIAHLYQGLRPVVTPPPA
jgi:hypothetical protein